jgi:UDP-N-acetylmuramoyl-tripeptide--D-alanyl-D-alanine ligase
MPAGTSFAVIEIGMNHPGEIAPLARLTRPHVAVVTTVAAAHLEAFDNVDGIAREKASIMDGLEPGGTAVLNADLPTLPILLAAVPDGAERRLFGLTNDANWRAVSVEIAEDATVVELDAAGEELIFKLATPGRHFALNGVAALAAADAAGADLARACIALSRWTAFEGRGTRETVVFDTGTRNGVFTLIDDAYNANPTSLTASLEVLAASKPRDADGAVTRGRRVAILGDMLELGADAVHIHSLVARQPTLKDIDVVHCAGPLMRNLWTALPAHRRGEWCETAQELAGKVRRLVGPGDVVLVKGSLGSRVSLCVDALRKLGQST